MTSEIEIMSKEQQRAGLIVKRDAITGQMTDIEHERRRLQALIDGLSDQYAALSNQIDALAPTGDECIRAYIATHEKTLKENRERQAETRARLAAAGVSPEDVAEVAGDAQRRRR